MDKRLISFLLRRPNAWFACAQVVGAIILKRKTVTVLREGLRVRSKIGNGEGLFCAVSGSDYEPEMNWFLRQMRTGDTFIDVGANIGIYSLHASRRLGPSGKVIAFEPTSQTFQYLHKNVELNRLTNVSCFEMALADHDGFFTMISGERPASNRVTEFTEQFGDTISAITLDTFCEKNSISRVDFIKADIEGGEFALFVGAKETLLRYKPMILFESMHSGPHYPERAFLKQLGYNIYLIEAGSLVEVSGRTLAGGNLIASVEKQS